MKKRIKVRFHLARGENYMKWKVEYPSGEVAYYSPTGVQLRMINCELKNHKKTSLKIFNGKNKTVCAWVLCDDIKFTIRNFTPYDIMGLNRLKYNPKKSPFWVIDDNEVSVDGFKFGEIGSVDFRLYITKN